MDKDRLYVTIFEGDEKENFLKMKKHLMNGKNGLTEDRILSGKKKDNFWEMGDTGPVGLVQKFIMTAEQMKKEKKLMEKLW